MEADGRPQELALRLPVQRRSVAYGRQAVVTLATQLGLSPEAIWRVQLTVSEALTNAVVHAHRTDADADADAPSHHLVLIADYDDENLRVSVSDRGVGLIPRSDSPGAGLGLSLMATNADALDIDSQPGHGTTVHLTFRR
jgi:anti-sigma regulatory factor (Ser/Thr protein kinase)